MSRAHHNAERKAQGDKVYTRPWVAEDMVRHFSPSGRILEPCRGGGAIYDLLPAGAFWCEIDEGRDFFLFDQPVDWTISNPPYDQTRAFMRHAFKLSENVVFLVPARNITSGYGTVREMSGWGGMAEIRWYGTGSKLGFPMGNAIAAFHWRRGHNGDTRQSFYEDDNLIAALSAPASSSPAEACEYCDDGKYMGLPGNACENCLNTGLKYPEACK